MLLYGNQFWSIRSPGGGELSLSACPGVGNRPPSEKKIANPRGCARGGMVTGRIEPCIMQEETIIFSLDNAKSPKEKRAAYKSVQVQLQNRGKLKLCEMFSTSIELEISDFLEVVLQNTTCIALETIVFTFWLFYLFTYCFFILL